MNEIPTYAFKYVVDKIAPVLASLFNESVSNGIFPACLKITIPIHKSESKTEVKNYRPISALPFVRKLFERLIHSRLYSFFDKYIKYSTKINMSSLKISPQQMQYSNL